MNEQLTYLIQGLDHNEYSYESEVISNNSIDWRKNFKGIASIVIFPKSVEKLVNVIKKCNEKKISVIPQGGNTSLVGGSVPLENSKKFQVIINFKKLNKIINFDPNSFSIQIESGCILEDIQNFLSKKNFCFPLSIGSRGNCQMLSFLHGLNDIVSGKVILGNGLHITFLSISLLLSVKQYSLVVLFVCLLIAAYNLLTNSGPYLEPHFIQTMFCN